MKRIQQFAANFLSYIPAKYYYNGSAFDWVIVKTKRDRSFWANYKLVYRTQYGFQLHNYSFLSPQSALLSKMFDGDRDLPVLTSGNCVIKGRVISGFW